MGSLLLDLAVKAAQVAGRALLDRYGRAGEVWLKTTATDPVSEADQASEALLVATILEARPDDGVMGEEGADHRSVSGLRWVLDPLDGTVNYLYGHPGWSVSVACEKRIETGWETLVGVVHDPLAGETYRAAWGEGAWLGDRRLRVNDPVAPGLALVATGFSYEPEVRRRQGATAAALLPRVRDIRRVGSAALDLCAVAAGRVDAYYEDSSSRWDWLAGALVATEAGAVVTPLRSPEGSVGVLAAGPALHRALGKLVR